MGGGMELPPEHINFGNCNIRPGRNPSFAPPTNGYTMDFKNDYPDQDTNYSPICTIEKYPQAYSGDSQGQFPVQSNSLDHNITSLDKNPPIETTKTLGIKYMHIPDDLYIEYNNPIPNNGPHRTMWAAYGDYHYCPPTRYMHNLEHGAIVFLYHACARNEQVKKFKNLAKNCLWKHIISGWEKGLNETYPFAIVAWHKVLYLKNMDDVAAVDTTVVPFIKRYAKAGGSGEGNCWGNGGFVNQLIRNASIVTSVEDTEICPNGYGDSGGVLNVAEPIVTPKPEEDEQDVDEEKEGEMEPSEELQNISVSTMNTEVSDENSAEITGIDYDEKMEIKNDFQNSSKTQTSVENKIADLQLETTTLAQAVAQNSDKILHEAVIATFAVMFLLVLVI